MTAPTLEDYRKKIDEVNGELLKLLNQRATYVLEIGKIKKQSNQEIYVPDRERQVLESLYQQNTGPLSKDRIKSIFQEIMRVMREMEK